jgi:DNA-binding GntR family transcriptional regulator
VRIEHKTKAALALEGLREAIHRGELLPGERITVVQLSERLGMSVTPIREAIRVLEAEGLVVNEPHRGVTVTSRTLAEEEELTILRASMEALATRYAVPLVDHATLEELERLQDDMEEAVADGDDARLTDGNARFHLAIYNASGLRYTVGLIERLWMPFHRSPIWDAGDRDASLVEHRAILDAIRTGDADEASVLMCEHVARAHRVVVEHTLATGRTSVAVGALNGRARSTGA